MFPDVTYEAKLVENGGAWRLAAAGMARDLAAQANAKMQSFSTGGDLAITWGNRSRGWLDIAVALERAHIDAESRENGGAGDVSFALPSRGDWDDAEYSNGLKGWR